MRVIKTFEGIKDNSNINVKIADDDATIKFQRIWTDLDYFVYLESQTQVYCENK